MVTDPVSCQSPCLDTDRLLGIPQQGFKNQTGELMLVAVERVLYRIHLFDGKLGLARVLYSICMDCRAGVCRLPGIPE